MAVNKSKWSPLFVACKKKKSYLLSPYGDDDDNCKFVMGLILQMDSELIYLLMGFDQQKWNKPIEKCFGVDPKLNMFNNIK